MKLYQSCLSWLPRWHKVHLCSWAEDVGDHQFYYIILKNTVVVLFGNVSNFIHYFTQAEITTNCEWILCAVFLIKNCQHCAKVWLWCMCQVYSYPTECHLQKMKIEYAQGIEKIVTYQKHYRKQNLKNGLSLNKLQNTDEKYYLV